jgi:hypothetical protein
MELLRQQDGWMCLGTKFVSFVALGARSGTVFVRIIIIIIIGGGET